MRTATAWTAAAITLAAVCAGVWIDAVAGGNPVAVASAGMGTAAFALIGATIVARLPGNRIGWVMCGVGVAFAVHRLTASYAVAGFHRGWPAADWSAWYGSLGFTPSFLLAFVLLPLLYPDGRLPSPRWRPVLWAVALMLVSATVLAFTEPTLDPGGLGTIVDNRFHTEALNFLAPVVGVTVAIGFAACLFGGVAAIVVRFRRSSGGERQQVKWFLAAAVLPPVGFAVSTLPVLDPYQEHLWGAMVVGLPVAIGIAIFRYRLYEIDRLISRTVSYALVLATVAGIYIVGVVGLSTALRAVAGQAPSDLVVAGSTLVAAAAFTPARRRIQRAVDRRFNRSRYDSQRTIEEFATRLRDDVHLDALVAELRYVAAETMRPSSISLSLVTPPGRSEGLSAQ
jgi:hypothetical protein